MTNTADLYGGTNGFKGEGFHKNISDYGPSNKKYLNPNEEGFVSVFIGRPQGPLLKIIVTLVNEEEAEIIEKSLEFDMFKEQEKIR